jgi:protein-L-isoaspartate(D-aspartate) O-methyltransferase
MQRSLKNITRSLGLAVVLSFALPACAQETAETKSETDGQDFAERRQRMVENQIAARGIDDERVLEAMREVPRHEFMPPETRDWAYADRPVPIGEGQTISQPFVVAFMTEAIDPQPDDKVLEIGTGSGYQAAVLSRLVDEVYTIEIFPSLGEQAREDLLEQGYDNVNVRVGDGFRGWPEEAPFDKIIVTASPEEVPEPLKKQLAEGGRMIIPVGKGLSQNLRLLIKEDGRLKEQDVMPVRFVPLINEKGERY